MFLSIVRIYVSFQFLTTNNGSVLLSHYSILWTGTLIYDLDRLRERESSCDIIEMWGAETTLINTFLGMIINKSFSGIKVVLMPRVYFLGMMINKSFVGIKVVLMPTEFTFVALRKRWLDWSTGRG